MRIIIEEHRYAAADVEPVLRGIGSLADIEGYVSVNYVGYFYNTDERIRDCVFILPKVLLEDRDGQELVFGKYRPEDIINLDAHNPLTATERDFIYEFAVWIYRAITVFRLDRKSDTSIVYHRKIAQAGRGGRRMGNTFLDILLSLLQFSKDNQDFLFFTLRNIHSGLNKINWTRTIATTPAIVQDGRPSYLTPVNRKRQVNLDEELLIIFFSILNYINGQYGFPVSISCHFQLITGQRFLAYLQGMGKVRLRQIKYKYFSDKALRLWNLCYAFFDAARQINVSNEQREYLLVKNFNIVFEAIIDELIGDRDIPAGLKDQDDGKRIDHLYTYKGLTTHDEDKPIYYIGDSKYYKRNNSIGREAVYKQFTYARNVIQWNLNLFLNDGREDGEVRLDRRNFGKVGKLRDDLTEGYNVIPNFFISARLNQELSYRDEISVTDRGRSGFSSSQFRNRLFDRDTLLVCHYDVNFLYVISLYARNNSLQKAAWKEKVRAMFRTQVQEMLRRHYDFYAMQPHPQEDGARYLREHFQQVLGKVYRPFTPASTAYSSHEFLSLALEKDDPANTVLLAELRRHFYVEPCALGENPFPIMAAAVKAQPAITELPAEAWADNILALPVSRMDGWGKFYTHTAEACQLIDPPAIDFRLVRFLLPIISDSTDGYYDVTGMDFAVTASGHPCLRFRLGTFHPLGGQPVQVYPQHIEGCRLLSLQGITRIYEENQY
ncbi:MAG: restriction endonuclease [Prevotella sp.]|nr:restriction endonuclease [Prevotella sp.]